MIASSVGDSRVLVCQELATGEFATASLFEDHNIANAAEVQRIRVAQRFGADCAIG